MNDEHLNSQTTIKSKLIGTPYDIFQLKDHAYNLDSILLANFITTSKNIHAIHDFGTGQGVLLLYLSLKTKIPLIGYEIQKELVDIAQHNVEYNQLKHQISIVHKDVKDIAIEHIDCIVSNPPYFKVTQDSHVSDIHSRALARHEIHLDLEALFLLVSKKLRFQGVFFLIHRADRFEEIMSLAEKVSLKPKIIQFIHPYADKEANQVLIKFNKMGASELKVYPPIILYDRMHVMSETLKSMYKGDYTHVT